MVKVNNIHNTHVMFLKNENGMGRIPDPSELLRGVVTRDCMIMSS